MAVAKEEAVVSQKRGICPAVSLTARRARIIAREAGALRSAKNPPLINPVPREEKALADPLAAVPQEDFLKERVRKVPCGVAVQLAFTNGSFPSSFIIS
jgi:hypothetical protein